MTIFDRFRYGVYGSLVSKHQPCLVSAVTADIAFDRPPERRFTMSFMQWATWAKKHWYSKRFRLQMRGGDPFKARPGRGGRRSRHRRGVQSMRLAQAIEKDCKE